MPLNIDWQQILLHLLNFVLLAFILYILLYKPIKKFMQKRTDYYADMQNKAQSELDDAKQLKADYDNKLKELDGNIDEMKKSASLEVEKYTQEQMDKAHEQAEKIISEAKQSANVQKQKIIDQASKEIKDMVTEATEKIVLQASASQSLDQFLDLAERSEGNDKKDN